MSQCPDTEGREEKTLPKDLTETLLSFFSTEGCNRHNDSRLLAVDSLAELRLKILRLEAVATVRR